MHKKCLIMKFFHMLHDVMENQEALGISSADMRKFKDLKIETKKALIRNKCEVKLLTVDMMAKLWEKPVDLAGINKIIDKKYDLKKQNMKKLVQAMVAFKKMLGDDQMRMLKQLCREQRHEEAGVCCK